MRYLLILFLSTWASSSGIQKIDSAIRIIPQPQSVNESGGSFRLSKNCTVYCPEELQQSVLKTFAVEVKDYLSVKPGGKMAADIEINFVQGKGTEGYSIRVVKNKILIGATNPHGVFNGLQSLRQLIIFAEEKDGISYIPCCSIEDFPLYSWRGLMLDESRHFFGASKVKQLIDIMALHKLNIFHWHLTDCSGWRLEIKKYPKLTTVGGIGNNNDPNTPAMYYTQEQVEEIVKYAAERFIQIVPEIDMPGHAAASNRAYPEFSGGGSPKYPEFTFNPGKEGTYSYITDILREVATLFPAPYIHIGGDEVSFGNQQWATNEQVKTLMQNNDLGDLKAVEKYFVTRMADTVRSLKKIAVGWDEIADLKLNPDDVIIMWWRQDKPAQLDSALSRNFKVVLCPRIPLYFDFVQNSIQKWGRRWNGLYCDQEKVYSFPPDSLFRIKGKDQQVLGIQANLWTEVIQNDKRLDYMTYPRLSALAEAAWTKREVKNYPDFLVRLKPMLKYLSGQNIYFFDIFNPAGNPEPSGPAK